MVTDLIKAGRTIVAISGSQKSSVVFEATGDVEKIELADASIGLTAVIQNKLGYLVEAMQGLIPLIGLCKIQPRFIFWGEDFKPLLYADTMRMLTTMSDIEDIRGADLMEDFYFGQLM